MLPIKGLVVLEILSQGLEEKPEFPELEEVGPVLVLAGGGLLGEVEGSLDGRLAVEQLVALKDVPHAAVNLSKELPIYVCLYDCGREAMD